MKNSNAKKSATLGIPHGTANGRLRKNILFHLLCRLEENVCFVCEKLIEKVEDLSIEHKEPWEGRSADLFWDLSNIAFSHLKCNRQHSYNNNRDRRMVMPEGMHWCHIHKAFLPIENFSKETNSPTGLRYICKEHQHYYRKV